jgi:hypothetical protein
MIDLRWVRSSGGRLLFWRIRGVRSPFLGPPFTARCLFASRSRLLKATYVKLLLKVPDLLLIDQDLLPIDHHLLRLHPLEGLAIRPILHPPLLRCLLLVLPQVLHLGERLFVGQEGGDDRREGEVGRLGRFVGGRRTRREADGTGSFALFEEVIAFGASLVPDGCVVGGGGDLSSVDVEIVRVRVGMPFLLSAGGMLAKPGVVGEGEGTERFDEKLVVLEGADTLFCIRYEAAEDERAGLESRFYEGR